MGDSLTVSCHFTNSGEADFNLSFGVDLYKSVVGTS